MIVLFYGIVLGSCVLLVREAWHRLLATNLPTSPGSFRSWCVRGLGFSVLCWFVGNLGIFRGIPPLLPDLVGLAGVSGLGRVFRLTAPGMAVIGSFWAAITLGWLLAWVWVHSGNRSEVFAVGGICSLVSVPLAGLVVYAGGLLAAGFAGIVWLWPVLFYTLDVVPGRPARPAYSRAIAKLKFGKYTEAEWEVIRQLEQYEDDFDGWMLLADLYATRFGDLDGATQVISDLITQPNLTRMQVSVAMHRLADWHLRLREDPEAARTILAQLSQRCPGGYIERMAQLRMEQLPVDSEELRERKVHKPIRLPALSEDFDPSAAEESTLDDGGAAVRANRCVEKLTRDPNDTAAREEFARLLAEQLGKVDAAIEQLELLLAMPEQPLKKQAEWLGLLAAWQLRYKGNRSAAKALLKRLIAEFPESSRAFAAQRRLNLEEMEERMELAKTRHHEPLSG
ncbi:MAG: tetratricopeptide repeat protein [Verrucomicrobia bacterium]|nr:tetratricopeptide repeat protein [Verrucomicrobiota bacterium]